MAISTIRFSEAKRQSVVALTQQALSAEEIFIVKKLVGIIGSGMIGRDPFHPRAWSGSSKFFFETCARHDVLQTAIEWKWPIICGDYMLCNPSIFGIPVGE